MPIPIHMNKASKMQLVSGSLFLFSGGKVIPHLHAHGNNKVIYYGGSHPIKLCNQKKVNITKQVICAIKKENNFF